MQASGQTPDHGYDPLLMAAVLALTVIGFGVISSAIFGNALNHKQLIHANNMIYKQFLAFGVGMAMFFMIVSSRWKFFYKTQKRMDRSIVILTAIGFITLLGLLAFGHRVGGATRWYSFGIFSVQPGEFFKVIFMIYLAYALGKAHKNLAISSIYVIKPLILLLFVDATLFLLPDRGSLIQLSVLAMMITVIAMLKKKHIAIVLVFLMLIASVVILISPNLLARILSYLFPELFAKGSAYQVIMSSTMVKMGGVFGAGLGKGTLGALHWVPEQFNDYIVAVLVEDLGLAGLLAVTTLYLVILWRSTILATHLKRPVHRYAAFGLGLLISSQAIINIGVAINMLPTKGAILPFISYGGSSMVAFLVAIGGIEWLHRYAPRVDE